MNSQIRVPIPVNEPIRDYAPGSPERAELKAKLKEMSSAQIDIPLFIGGREIRTGKRGDCRMPHDHEKLIGRYHIGGRKETQAAVAAALKARRSWAATPWHERAAIFLKAAELLAGPYRSTLNAATMLCQSKNAFQAEIDSACELIDFWRVNTAFAEQLYAQQPFSPKGTWNRVEYRALEGFVYAVTPFNFTSIAGNLPTAPAIMGNTVVWKPAANTVFSAHYVMAILRAAGLPDGVVNLVTGSSAEISEIILNHPELAGIHFTGSTPVFKSMWETVGRNIGKYRGYPRLVGETGGKDFVFAHPSADPQALAVALTRGAFEYQGQKCSAASRAYIPDNLWPKVRKIMAEQLSALKMGGVEDFTNFVNAVIDKKAFETITGYIAEAKPSKGGRVIFGGKSDASKGYFIEPTVILASKPDFKTMAEEIFGPVLTVYAYPEKRFEETLRLCDKTSPYALTGAIFSQDRAAVSRATEVLANAAGNFYINDKPTGAVVNQQPFGGARASGTNDKAGSFLNLVRWTSARTIKENFVPPQSVDYPFMSAS
ncbi:MAG: L-glutamate gamma-semialdehyde dehydrogenase [Elusimicrobiota bacterium]|jgi:1-pyrroline-5-carboxylate dehydrogenase